MAGNNKIIIEIEGKDLSKPAFDSANQGATRLKYNLEGLESSSLRAQAGADKFSTSLRGLVGAFGAFSALQIGRDILDTGIQFERLEKSLTAISGASGATQDLEYLRGEANRLGQDLFSLGDAFKGITAAAKGTSLEGREARQVFSAVAEAGTVLGLSTEQVQGSLLALSQMMSKGKVSAEELRGQLGERLPGAFQTAADAMGVTTAELDAMLQKGEIAATDFLPRFARALHEQYGGSVGEAANSATAAINRFKNSVHELMNTLADSGAIDFFTSRLDYVTRKIGEVKNAWNFNWGGQLSRGWDEFKNTMNIPMAVNAYFTRPASGSPGEFAQLERQGMLPTPAEIAKVKELAAASKKAGEESEKAAKRTTGHAAAVRRVSTAQKEFNKTQSEAAQIAKDLQTPFEKIQARVQELDSLFRSGALGAGMYGKALASLRHELSSPEGQSKLTNLGAGRVAAQFKETYGEAGTWGDAGIRVGGTINEIASSKWETAWDNIDTTADKFSELKDAINGWSRDSASAIVDFCNGTQTNFGNMVKNVLGDLEKLMVQKFVTDPLFSAVSSGVSSLFGGVFGGGKASGGPVKPFTSYLVGESGPEIITMGSSPGFVSPNGALGGNTVNNQFTVNVNMQSSGSGNVDAFQGQQIGEQVSKALESKVIQIIQTQMRPGNVLNRGVRG